MRNARLVPAKAAVAKVHAKCATTLELSFGCQESKLLLCIRAFRHLWFSVLLLAHCTLT